MRLQIGRGGAGAQPDDVAGALAACHARIRNFCAIAGRLARGAESPRSEIVEAAEAVDRYFSVALPLHVEDEERALAPRLERAAPDLAEALDRMRGEHVAIEQVLADVTPRWRTVAAEPARLAEHAAALAREAARLEELFEPHLRAEETLVFPALSRLLDAGELSAVFAELRARRA